MDKILNLTQHKATPDQIKAGVVEPSDKGAVQDLLTFKELPTAGEIREKAEKISKIAEGQCPSGKVMIGGAPYLMGPLEKALKDKGLVPLYAFSERESVEVALPDGSVKKTFVFKHLGFVGDDTPGDLLETQ